MRRGDKAAYNRQSTRLIRGYSLPSELTLRGGTQHHLELFQEATLLYSKSHSFNYVSLEEQIKRASL